MVSISTIIPILLSDNGRVVSEYTDKVEEQHVYIKETVDTVFPSNIRVLQVRKRGHFISSFQLEM